MLLKEIHLSLRYVYANILKEASDAVEQLLVSDPELTDDDSLALVNYFKEHTAVNVVDFRTIWQ